MACCQLYIEVFEHRNLQFSKDRGHNATTAAIARWARVRDVTHIRVGITLIVSKDNRTVESRVTVIAVLLFTPLSTHQTGYRTRGEVEQSRVRELGIKGSESSFRFSIDIYQDALDIRPFVGRVEGVEGSHRRVG